MLNTSRAKSGGVVQQTEFPVEIVSVATAVPDHIISQDDVTLRAKTVFPHFASMESLYVNTGISTRYACFPASWYHEERSWPERTDAFQEHAVPLLEQAARGAVEAAGLSMSEIDGLVVNTITGIAVPSLDALLMNRLELRQNVERLPIFGFGCGGGVAGLARTARMAQAMPGGNILFLTIDLCTLCLRVNDPSIGMFVSTALFGDGAAGVVVRNTAHEAGEEAPADTGPRGRVVTCGEYLWHDTRHIMGWTMTDDGFGVLLSPDLITLTREHLRPALDRFLEEKQLSLSEFDGFLFHPGGRKVLETVEDVVGLTREELDHSWSVLRDYGNMSSATAIFILHRAMAHAPQGRHLLVAFGPGFSVYFMVIDF